MITTLITLGERLKFARKKRGLSQASLAKLAGVAQGTIGNLESGERKSPRGLLSIARALKVDPNWLETGKGHAEATHRPALAESTQAEYLVQQRWPFVSISQKQWWALSEEEQHKAEALVATFLDRDHFRTMEKTVTQ